MIQENRSRITCYYAANNHLTSALSCPWSVCCCWLFGGSVVVCELTRGRQLLISTIPTTHNLILRSMVYRQCNVHYHSKIQTAENRQVGRQGAWLNWSWLLMIFPFYYKKKPSKEVKYETCRVLVWYHPVRIWHLNLGFYFLSNYGVQLFKLTIRRVCGDGKARNHMPLSRQHAAKINVSWSTEQCG